MGKGSCHTCEGFLERVLANRRHVCVLKTMMGDVGNVDNGQYANRVLCIQFLGWQTSRRRLESI